MAKISLRAYNQEIENLINRGESEEAIAHCKYILKLFPKHIDTYRLLGKAYLESQRYTEASDILKRVLSVLPDDFISQIGLSIIREDEGNLDAAIWHMERAFEVQPSNAAIQEELRRLYGKRDGITPPRVRLTRGALVRLYTKGELYPQAIAEARAALAEDPQRTDLMVVLARCYHNSGQAVEATEVCSRLISKLPFCYEANRILSLVLPKTSKSEDAKIYQQRVTALDPYYGLISPNTPTSDQVPDNAVTIERLTWQPSSEATEQPDWAKSIGVEIKEETADMPDWMKAIPEKEAQRPSEPQAVEPQAETEQSISPPEEDEDVLPQDTTLENEELIPDWMQSAGWSKSDTPASESEDSESISITDSIDLKAEAIQQDDVPDWIKSLAPPEETQDVQTPEEAARLDMLNQILPSSASDISSDEEAEAASLEAVTTDSRQEEIPAIQPSAVEEQDSESPQIETQATSQESSSTPGSDEIPDWLRSFSEEERDQEEAKPPFELTDEMPDWLKSLQDANSEEVDLPPTVLNTETDSNEDQLSPKIESLPETDDQDWLEKLALEHASAQETLEPATESQSEEPPDWIFEIGDQNEIPAIPEENENLPALEEDAALISESRLPDEPDGSQQIQDEDSLQEELDEGFAWLESLAAKQGADEDTLISDPKDRIAETPDWLKDLGKAEISQDIGGQEESGFFETPSVPEQPEEESSQWISEFEETSPAVEDQEQLLNDERETDLTFDVVETAGAQIESQETDSTLPLEELPSEQFKALIPEEELESATGEEFDFLAEESGTPSVTEENQFAVEFSEPLEEAAPDQEYPEESTDDSLSFESQTRAAESTPPFIEQPEARPDQTEQKEELTEPEIFAAVEKEVETTQFIDDISETTEPSGFLEETEASAPAYDSNDIFAWLESLAQKQGADEETLITRPEERSQTPPEWLTKAALPDENISPDLSDEVQTMANLNLDQEQLSQLEIDESVEDTQEIVHRTDKTEVEPEIEQGETPSDILEILEDDFSSTLMEIEQESVAEEEPALPDWLEGLESEIAAPQEIDEIAEAQPAASDLSEVLPSDLEETPYKTTELDESIQNEISIEQPLSKQQPLQPSEETVPAIVAEPRQKDFLSVARQELNNQNVDAAFEAYNQAIQEGGSLDEIIEDLNQAVYQYPLETLLWLALGDALSQKGEIQKALDAYSKGEELLQ